MFKDYADYYDLIYAQKSYKDEANFVYSWAKKPKTILDLACGTGKHIYYLAPKVEEIIGTDASLEMLSRAYIRTKKYDNVRYIFNKTDKRLLDLPKVDCVISLFNAVGYIGLEKCLKYIPLKKNGYFIFDIFNEERIKKEGFNIMIKEYNWGTVQINPVWSNRHEAKLKILVVPAKKKFFTEYHRIFLYSSLDMKRVCHNYGYKITDIKPTETWAIWYRLQRK